MVNDQSSMQNYGRVGFMGDFEQIWAGGVAKENKFSGPATRDGINWALRCRNFLAFTDLYLRQPRSSEWTTGPATGEGLGY